MVPSKIGSAASFFHLPEGAMAAGKRAHRPRGQRRRCYLPWRARHRTISCACERCPGGRACLAATSCDGLLEWSRRAASAQGAGTGRDCARAGTGRDCARDRVVCARKRHAHQVQCAVASAVWQSHIVFCSDECLEHRHLRHTAHSPRAGLRVARRGKGRASSRRAQPSTGV